MKNCTVCMSVVCIKKRERAYLRHPLTIQKVKTLNLREGRLTNMLINESFSFATSIGNSKDQNPELEKND